MSDDIENDVPSIVTFSESIADAEAPPLLPVRKYPARIKGAQAATSANSGKRYALVSVYIGVEDFPPDFPADAYPDGVTLAFRRASLEDDRSSRYRLKKFCESCDFPIPGTTINLNDWVGRDVTAEIAHTTYEGEQRMEIKSISAA